MRHTAHRLSYRSAVFYFDLVIDFACALELGGLAAKAIKCLQNKRSSSTRSSGTCRLHSLMHHKRNQPKVPSRRL